MSKILVTGGCGYIGSHTLVDLINNGFTVVCVDNLSNAEAGCLQGVSAITGVAIHNICVDLCDLAATRAVFEAHPDISGVIHFAAYKDAGESVTDPLKYYHNNIPSLTNILTCMRDYGVQHLIFSSSCTVYGNQDQLPVTEQSPMMPAESAYGRTKQIGEWMIEETVAAHPHIKAVLLRYFNPAGAHETALIGEMPQRVTNLVPVIVDAAAGRRQHLTVFGNDYPTRDGSCLRDFIHVMDLAHAHTLAVRFLMKGKNSKPVEVFNLGTGQGVTVLEAIEAFQVATSLKVPHIIGPRRPGDVVAIYANNDLAREALGWSPQYGIEDIMRTAWQWELQRQLSPTAQE